MIPVRVPAGWTAKLASDRRFTIGPDHPMAEHACPVCDGPLFATPRADGEGLDMVPGPVVLVFVGIAPEDRKDGGWTTGAAVAVHEACAGAS